MLDVSNARRGDRAYFDALWAEVGSQEALGGLLHFLQGYDLAGYNKREVVETEALLDQRERSASGVVAWALDLASRGEVQHDKGSEPWRAFVPTRLLFEDFRAWARENKWERGAHVETFSRELRSMLGLKPLRRALREHMVPAPLQGKPGYVLPATPEDFGQLARAVGGFARPEDKEPAPAEEETAFDFGANVVPLTKAVAA